MNKQKKKKRGKKSVQNLLGLQGFTTYGLKTTGGELVFSLEEDASPTAPLSLRAWNGEQVTFTVTWDKEAGAK